LRHLISDALNRDSLNRDTGDDADDHAGIDFYIIVEKILAGYEHLPDDWPVSGTTGYETAHLINGLYVYPGSESSLTRLYTRFTGRDADFDELLYERKKFVIHNTLSSELTVLANKLSVIAQSDRVTRDFTQHGLREAIAEIVACFPVYRTYITSARISEEDIRYVQWAVAQAKKRRTASDINIFDFIHQTLMLTRLHEYTANTRRKIIQFTLRFQQYTAPVMAKGMEDTSFYIYHRLVSLNDVGFDPRSFGISTNAFHEVNRQRQLEWPHTMVTTSTHDSKRGEDVRARINVLSEVADDWRMHLARWRRINRSRKRQLDGRRAPSRNDEYLLYQILVGSWPLETLDVDGLAAFRERIEAYMLKAVREAKMQTSWINPNEDYEEAVRHFVHVLLKDPERNAFLADFIPFQKRIARFGLLNSLSQTLLKLTVPGIPDIYQGNELWAFNLVDPDNRRPVDYLRRGDFLRNIIENNNNSNELYHFIQNFVEHIEDGVAKLYLIWKTLTLRRRLPRLFADGDYIGLAILGQQADHVCAFARRLEGQEIIVVTTRSGRSHRTGGIP
jgi:(1->4)-alpha-D-glucan 1-alpha-D-glucosylmutase